MTHKKTSSKRTYLTRDDRREALLDIAASVVEERGWPNLSMIAVAEAAHVSRQLIYQHFTSVDELMADTMAHLFQERYHRIRGSINDHARDFTRLIRVVDEQTFNDRPARVRALWQMITATYSENEQTSRMGSRLRHLLVKLWAPTLAEAFHLDEVQSRAAAWMLNMAFWGAHQLVYEGEISRKTATDLFTWMILRLHGSESGADSCSTSSHHRGKNS